MRLIHPLRLLCLCAATLFLAGCATTSPAPKTPAELAAQPGMVKAEFIYEKAPFPSCHASTIAETKDGLIAAWFGGTAERNPDVCIWTAHYKNGAWTPPVEVANGVGFTTNRLPTWNPVLFQPKDGPLMLFYKVGPKPAEWWGMVMTSEDDGQTWSQALRLPDNILGPVKNKPVQLADGSIISPSSTEGSNGWCVHFERSIDNGKTWEKIGPVNDGKKLRAIQPSILVYPNNRLQAVGRNVENRDRDDEATGKRTGRIFEVWSDDGGKTWGELTLTDMPNPNSGTDAVTLKDGTQLLVYNHNPLEKGRTPLNVSVSKDGKHWNAALVIENEKGPQFSYPAVIQTSDGLVHIVYTWKRLRIKHAVVDPAKFVTKPIVDGQWPEL